MIFRSGSKSSESMVSTTSGKIAEFRRLLSGARSVLVLTGAGVSAESGVPTFRGSGGLWREFQATDLATPKSFSRSPSLVWEFYHYRRELVRTKEPNKGHLALAQAEKRFVKEGKRFNIITQNVDGLHRKAGSENVIEMHGNLFFVRCTKCHLVEENNSSPICLSLTNRGSPNENLPEIAEKDLPRCSKCESLLRPHIVWFGEQICDDVITKIDQLIQCCDLFLVVGTSSVVYPAAGYASIISQRNIPLIEINVETTPSTSIANYHFHAPAAQILPQLFENDLHQENE